MAWTQADIDALDEALKDPTSEVSFSDGRKHKYRSISEIIQARNLAAKSLAASNGKSRAALVDFRSRGNGCEYC